MILSECPVSVFFFFPHFSELRPSTAQISPSSHSHRFLGGKACREQIWQTGHLKWVDKSEGPGISGAKVNLKVMNN